MDNNLYGRLFNKFINVVYSVKKDTFTKQLLGENLHTCT